jgi:hypothetical protein
MLFVSALMKTSEYGQTPIAAAGTVEKRIPAVRPETVLTGPDVGHITVVRALQEMFRQRHAVLNIDAALRHRCRHIPQECIRIGQIEIALRIIAQPVLLVHGRARRFQIARNVFPILRIVATFPEIVYWLRYGLAASIQLRVCNQRNLQPRLKRRQIGREQSRICRICSDPVVSTSCCPRPWDTTSCPTAKIPASRRRNRIPRGSNRA